MNKRHKIYNDFPCIEDEFFNLIYIPLMDKYHKVSGYAISNLSLKNKLLEFSYHQDIHLAKIIKRYAVSNLLISMHEIVIGKKADKGYVIDHIDSDGLLNTEENLRYATSGLNAQNKEKQCNTSSKYIGVSFCKSKKKWVSRMNYNYKSLNLGSFEDEIEAAKVYDIHVIYYYKGQSPKTNNLLTKKEIEDIKYNGLPEKYIKKIRDLPKNICITKNNTYSVGITDNGKTYKKTVKTLEEAIIIKKQFLEKITENKEVSKYTEKITRNSDGLAVIYTSNGFECIVDENHWYDITQYKWNCYTNKNDKMCIYPSGRVDGKTIQLHIYVYEKYVGEIPHNMTVDHVKSDNILDVRLKNLRLADRSLQNHNKNMSQNRIDQYKGIYPTTTGYQVIVSGGNYGTYKTAEEAAKRANEIYTKIYGNQSTLNIIDYSKQTTIYDRIPGESITKEYIINLTKVGDVKNVVIIKGLNHKAGGKIALHKITLETLDEYKQIIVDILYPLID